MLRFYLFISLLFFSQAEAAQLHYILVVDTQAENIGHAVKVDLGKMRVHGKEITSNTQLELVEKIFQEDECRPKKVLEYLDSLEVTDEDVVFFYFNGHGFRTPSKIGNQWPYLYFTPEEHAVDFCVVTMKLLEKRPRLVVSIAECCNNFLPDKVFPVFHALKKGKIKEGGYIISNYENLFLNRKGLIMISSSIPGQFAWCHRFTGAFYTVGWLRAMKKEVNRDGVAQWDAIFEQATEELQVIKKLHGITGPQWPQVYESTNVDEATSTLNVMFNPS